MCLSAPLYEASLRSTWRGAQVQGVPSAVEAVYIRYTAHEHNPLVTCCTWSGKRQGIRNPQPAEVESEDKSEAGRDVFMLPKGWLLPLVGWPAVVHTYILRSTIQRTLLLIIHIKWCFMMWCDEWYTRVYSSIYGVLFKVINTNSTKYIYTGARGRNG